MEGVGGRKVRSLFDSQGNKLVPGCPGILLGCPRPLLDPFKQCAQEKFAHCSVFQPHSLE